jgi:hypothetical protein
MEYDHGVRVTQELYEMSPLERAITDFENTAKDHFNKPAQIPREETPAQKADREKSSKEALAYLAQERRKALTIISVQAGLEKYRSQLTADKDASRAQRKDLRQLMHEENHHPTDVLAKFMRADGRPQPSPRFTAHHIVQGKGKTENAAKARVNLHFYNVRINDPDNGVWMPRTKADKGHWAMPSAAAHSQIHTHNYETWVNASVQDVSGEAMLRARLVRVRSLLRDGKQPQQVTQKPDAKWNGQ